MICMIMAAAVLAAGLGGRRPRQTTEATQTVGGPRRFRWRKWSRSGGAGKNKSVDGHALKIAGQEFATGVGTHANSAWVVQSEAGGDEFTRAGG